MAHFIKSTVIGALGAVAIVVASNVIGEWLIAPWKYGNDGVILGVVGLSVLYLGVIINLPARLFAFGSDSLFVSIAAATAGFSMWGAAFASIVQCIMRRSSSTVKKRAVP
jgi:hypothetical protein